VVFTRAQPCAQWSLALACVALSFSAHRHHVTLYLPGSNGIIFAPGICRLNPALPFGPPSSGSLPFQGRGFSLGHEIAMSL